MVRRGGSPVKGRPKCVVSQFTDRTRWSHLCQITKTAKMAARTAKTSSDAGRHGDQPDGPDPRDDERAAAAHGIELGFNAHLVKPVDFDMSERVGHTLEAFSKSGHRLASRRGCIQMHTPLRRTSIYGRTTAVRTGCRSNPPGEDSPADDRRRSERRRPRLRPRQPDCLLDRNQLTAPRIAVGKGQHAGPAPIAPLDQLIGRRLNRSGGSGSTRLASAPAARRHDRLRHEGVGGVRTSLNTSVR
jgi:hypothetical protein